MMINKGINVTLSIIFVAAIFELDLKVLVMSGGHGSSCCCDGCGKTFFSLNSLKRHRGGSHDLRCGEAARMNTMRDSRIPWSPDSRLTAQNLIHQFARADDSEVFNGRFLRGVQFCDLLKILFPNRIIRIILEKVFRIKNAARTQCLRLMTLLFVTAPSASGRVTFQEKKWRC